MEARPDVPPKRVSGARSLTEARWIAAASPSARVVKAFEQSAPHRPSPNSRIAARRRVHSSTACGKRRASRGVEKACGSPSSSSYWHSPSPPSARRGRSTTAASRRESDASLASGGFLRTTLPTPQEGGRPGGFMRRGRMGVRPEPSKRPQAGDCTPSAHPARRALAEVDLDLRAATKRARSASRASSARARTSSGSGPRRVAPEDEQVVGERRGENPRGWVESARRRL